MQAINRATAILLLSFAVTGCGKSSSPVSPTTVHPNLSVTGIMVTGEVQGNGYVYRVSLRLNETAGVAATIASAQLSFVAGTRTIASSLHDLPLGQGAICPAHGSVETKELTTTDADGDPYATSVQAVVTFTDGASFSAIATATADVPPLPTPPAPATYTLIGLITDTATHAAIAGARIDVLAGTNAGRTVTTDGQGFYTFSGLAADTFRLRASAVGYFPGEQNVTVPSVPRADFELKRAVPEPCAYSVTPGSTSLPFSSGQLTIAIARLSGSCDWQASASVAWLAPAAMSGSGTAALPVSYATNTSFVGRTGTITISWADGSAQVSVAQGGETPVFCRVIVVAVNGQNPLTAPPTAGRYTASISTEPGVPSGVCGAWTASGSAGISFPGLNTGPQVPGTLTFDVSANPGATARSLQLSISLPPFGPSAMLTINQSGAP